MRRASIKMAFDSLFIFVQIFVAAWLGILWSRHEKYIFFLISGLFSVFLSFGLNYFDLLVIANPIHESKMVYYLGSFIIGCFAAIFFGLMEKNTK
jgi:Na+/proline symporter